MILKQFQTVGKDLFTHGLVSSHSGNLSVRTGDKTIITRRGCRLGGLQEQDLIETGVNKNDRNTPLASVELPVHRAIYQLTSAQAIVHAHLPHAIALSMSESEIVPNGGDGLAELGKVPVIGRDMDTRPGHLGEQIAEALKDHHIVLVTGHGSFAVGQLLEEAYQYTASLEEACQVIWLVKTLNKKSL